eukprot:5302025-Pyramimonas_sp.AAC.1
MASSRGLLAHPVARPTWTLAGAGPDAVCSQGGAKCGLLAGGLVVPGGERRRAAVRRSADHRR